VITASKEVFMRQYLSIAGLIFALSACTPLPPLPGDAAAKRFESVPDRAVIYLVRHPLDSIVPTSILLDDEMIGSTYKGTYIRMVVPAGPYRIAGMAGDSASIRVQAERGQLYFINQRTWETRRSLGGSAFQLVDPQYGRSLVLSGTLTSEVIR
jgi:hypothetical protein